MDVFTPSSYNPDARFAVPRGYLKGIAVVWYAGLTTVVTTGNPIFIHSTVAGFTNDTYITIRPEVWEWSTNAYSLDHIFQDEYSLRSDFVGKYRNSYDVRWAFNIEGLCNYVVLYYLGATIPIYTNLPTPTRSYWIELPPCPEILP
jgi:hypothetical protein